MALSALSVRYDSVVLIHVSTPYDRYMSEGEVLHSLARERSCTHWRGRGLALTGNATRLSSNIGEQACDTEVKWRNSPVCVCVCVL